MEILFTWSLVLAFVLWAGESILIPAPFTKIHRLTNIISFSLLAIGLIAGIFIYF